MTIIIEEIETDILQDTRQQQKVGLIEQRGIEIDQLPNQSPLISEATQYPVMSKVNEQTLSYVLSLGFVKLYHRLCPELGS